MEQAQNSSIHCLPFEVRCIKRKPSIGEKSPASTRSGFALIIALGLMAFILLLLLSITAFVRIETHTAVQSLHLLEARQNALLGMQLALGELQTAVGPDPRVTAKADVFDGTDTTRRHLTGVWDTSTGSFQQWMVSDFDRQSDTQAFAESPAPNPTDTDSTIMLGLGSLESSDGVLTTPSDAVVVSMDNTIISGNSQGTGRYAWWVDDEGVKARINLDATLAGKGKQSAVLALNNFNRGEVGSLADFAGLSMGQDQVSRLLNLPDLILAGIDKAPVQQRFFDFTTWSAGVLADVSKGGLKRDLSLAFELTDSDFNNSVFADSGPSSVNAPGLAFRVQPLFYGPNGGRGPTWHLLRDYYTIYQRVENPMTNPIFDAQAMRPNKDELGVAANPNGYGWETLAALRYQAVTSLNAGISGDALRSTSPPGDPSKAILIPIRANYTPYVQRNLMTFGMRFFEIPVPTDENGDEIRSPGDPGTWEYRSSELLTNPAYVVHNPYNISIRSQGMFSSADFGFFVKLESLLSGEIITFRTGGNEHVLKAGPTTFDPGELRIYEGIHREDDSNLSSAGPPSTHWEPEKASWNAPTIPVDPAAPSAPNVEIDFLPYSNTRWAYWLHNNIAEGATSVTASMDRNSFMTETYSYGGMRASYIYRDYEDWYLTDQTAIALNTEFFRKESNDAPIDFFNFDFFLKPADHRFRYPVFSHSNPLAPNITSINLFTGTADQRTGYPVLSPDWQFEIYSTNFPGMDILQSSGDNAYWGPSNKSSGHTHVASIELPTTPPLSLGKLQNANLGIFGHMPALAIGNSFASPYLPLNAVSETFDNLIHPIAEGGYERVFYDLSYLANEALWDSYFFSSYSLGYNQNDDTYLAAAGPSEGFDAAFDSAYSNAGVRTGSLPNPRMRLFAPRESLVDVRDKLFQASGIPASDGFERAAENLLVIGAFNIHSTSVEAWQAVLSGARNAAVYRSGESGQESYGTDRTPLSRLTQPTQGAYNGDLSSQEAWGGFTALTDSQIESLAESIVEELKLRINGQGGPFMSMADFVNRQLANNDFGLAGLLQAAIDKSGINQGYSSTANAVNLSDASANFPYPDNIDDGDGGARSSASGASAKILQGNILQAIGSFMSPRSDTFRIRSYGDVIDPITNEPTSRVWAEAVYQRTPEPVYPSATSPVDVDFWIPQNMERFGRRFQLISFRWLSEDEV